MKNKYKVVDFDQAIKYVDLIKIEGFIIKPKNSDGYVSFKIKQLEIMNQTFIEKIIYKKIQKKIDAYSKSIISAIEEDDEDGVIQALDDLERLKSIVERKYRLFLKDNYYNLLRKKLNNLYGKLKEKEMLFILNKEKELDTTKKSK